jgi:hypothetical protein
MYKVVEFFHDLHDGGHPYNPGDEFPREGAEATKERIAELSSTHNARGMKLIEKVEEKRRRKSALFEE